MNVEKYIDGYNRKQMWRMNSFLIAKVWRARLRLWFWPIVAIVTVLGVGFLAYKILWQTDFSHNYNYDIYQRATDDADNHYNPCLSGKEMHLSQESEKEWLRVTRLLQSTDDKGRPLFEAAVDGYEELALKGNAKAANSAAYIYENHLPDLDRNGELAYRYYHQAAYLGHLGARLSLGKKYFEGGELYPQSHQIAAECFHHGLKRTVARVGNLDVNKVPDSE